MAEADRDRSRVAAADHQLADRARDRGRVVSPERIRRWRRAKLLPSPSNSQPRPRTAPAGRTARIFGPEQLEIVDAIVAVLDVYANRGRPTASLALIVFAHGLPVDHDVLCSAIRDEMRTTRDDLRTAAIAARAKFPTPDPTWRISDTFETTEALARQAASTRAAGRMRRNLRQAKRPTDENTMLTILQAVAATAIAPEASAADVPANEVSDEDRAHEAAVTSDLLYAFGGHGLVEQVQPEGNQPATIGLEEFGAVLAAVGALTMQELPDDITAEELAEVRDLCVTVAATVRAVDDPAARRRLGGDQVIGFWDPGDPRRIAHMLTVWSLLNRLLPEPLNARGMADRHFVH